ACGGEAPVRPGEPVPGKPEHQTRMIESTTERRTLMTTVTTKPLPDYTAIKQRQQATWASGDFAIIGESLAEAADVRADERVLDVAAGNGNATLAAARRFAEVTSTDYVPELLDK